ncbi:MAG: hypothetical protein B6I38_10545 [Anaerolineaceae bacterium 4572_5.1]|nr:MAG: hypothetical protein B6I38_10545 [Anaerolineaceae bacterium 4572_5.1]
MDVGEGCMGMGCVGAIDCAETGAAEGKGAYSASKNIPAKSSAPIPIPTVNPNPISLKFDGILALILPDERRVFLVIFPIDGILLDIEMDFLPFTLAADDAVPSTMLRTDVKPALPDAFGREFVGFVDAFGHGRFAGANDCAQ